MNLKYIRLLEDADQLLPMCAENRSRRNKLN